MAKTKSPEVGFPLPTIEPVTFPQYGSLSRLRVIVKVVVIVKYGKAREPRERTRNLPPERERARRVSSREARARKLRDMSPPAVNNGPQAKQIERKLSFWVSRERIGASCG